MSGILDKLDKLDPANRQALAERLRQTKEKHAVRPAHVEPIAVVGIACRFPGGARNPDRFWELLMQGRSGVSRVPADRFDIDDYHDTDPAVPGAILSDRGAFIDAVDAFDAAFFGVSPREARRMDPQHRQLLEVAWEALENAGLTQASLRSGDVGGVFIGLMGNDYFATVQESPANIDAYTSTGTHYSFAANRLSFHLDLKGPSMAIDSACSSSLVAVHQACQSLRVRDCDFALAGGVNLVLSPTLSISYSKWGMLSPDGECKTFDASANGFVRGEGAGVVVLKRLDDALAHGDPILAVVRGSAVNQDGATSVITAPNGLAQQTLIRRALKVAGVDAGAVGYVETHGTGTSLGDPIEVEALNETYGKAAGERACVLGAVKTNVGHLEGAAGIAGFIKAVLAVHHGQIPPNRNFRQLNPLIRLEGSRLRLAGEATEWKAPKDQRFSAVSSFGAGGTNAHVIVQGAPEPARRTENVAAGAGAHLRTSFVCVSAKSECALRKQVERLGGWLRRGGPSRIEDIAYTAFQRRNHFEHRVAFTVDSPEGLLEAAESFLAGRAGPSWSRGTGTARAERPVFVFSGQGSQWRGMGRGLMAREPRFAAEIAAIDRDFIALAGWSIAECLQSGRELDATEIAQPCLFAVQMALVACLEEMGIRPAAVVGHSVGEIAAACVAGLVDRAAATALVFHRARLMQRLTGAGKMAAIGLAPQDVEARLGVGLTVAAVNGPRSVVVAGEAAPLEALVQTLRAEGVFTRMLPVDYAFHSPQADAILEELRRAVDGIFGAGARMPSPRVPIVSTVTGAELSAGTAHGEHWTQNVRRPVVFAQAVAQLLEQGHDTFLEVSPHPVLNVDLRESFQAHDACAQAVATLRREQDDVLCLRAVPAGLYTAGLSPDVLPGPRQGTLVSLPNYAWEHRRHWLDTARSARLSWVHTLDWDEVPMPPAAPRKASWLVVGAATGLVEALCAHLHAHGHAVSRATPDAVRAVVAVSEFDRVDFVVYVPESAEESDVESSCLSLLRLVQALEKASSPSKVWVVTRGAHAVVPGDTVQPFAAPVWGLGRGLALEAPRSMAGLIDLSDGEVGPLVEAMLHPGGEDQIALRADRRYALRLRPRLDDAGHSTQPLELDASGLYLVTGGTRGLGLLAAKRLAERGARHLALVGRRAPEANAIRGLEELGVSVAVHAADVSDSAAMRALFESWKQAGRPLKGIVHAAGVSRDAPFAEVDQALLAETLAPKVAGAWCLHQLSLEHPLDFFVVYSSAASVWGSSGLAPYAAANEFLNALAVHRRALGLPALSVCWGMWDAEGMTTAERRQSWTRLGLRAMAPERALDALEDLLASRAIVATVADVKWATFRPIYEMNGRRPLLAALAEGAPTPAPLREVEPPVSLKEQWQHEPAPQQRERVLALLRETAAQVLGLDAHTTISAEQGLFSMGFDSVTAVEFAIRLNRLLSTGYSATVVFDHPTLKEICDLVLHDCFGWTREPSESAEEAQGHDLEALLAFVENVNDDEAERLLAQTT